MTRRKRAILISLGTLGLLAAAAFVAVLAIAETDWGHEHIRRIAVSQLEALLGGRGHVRIGHLDAGLSGRVTVDSIELVDDHGTVVAALARMESEGSLTGVLTGNLHLSRLLLVRPYLLLEQGDSTWNVARLFASSKSGIARRSTFVIRVDSAEVRDGRVVLVMPDSLPALPPVRREFSALQLAVGKTQLLGPNPGGGLAPITRLSLESSVPPLSLREAAGTLHWWSDSLALALPGFRLPGSHGSLRGGVAWGGKGPVRVDFRIHADSVSLADIAWITPIIPNHGGGSADVHIRTSTNPPYLDYVISALDVRATNSRITGAFTATAGRQVSITDLALTLQPLDLDLVREMLGGPVPPKVWQGSITGTVRGRGGPLRALRLDEVQVAFTDRRAQGAVSHLTLAGEMNVRAKATQLHDFEVQVQDLDVRTLGAVAKRADSLHGALVGRLVLEGPTANLGFHDLALTHVDGNLPRSYFRGEGRLASDVSTRWFDAALTLDTVAIATLVRGRTELPLRGSLHGTLELHATRDTMSINTLLRSGEASVRFTGESLLDSARTWVRGAATLQGLDPRAFVARKDIPFLRLDGRADVEVDGTARRTEGHVNLTLDTTSVIGDSPVQLGRFRAGVDETGFHLDTAEVHARDWRLSARGRLGRTGVTNDSLVFRAEVDSLSSLRAILLDSAGVALVDSLQGAVTAAGTLVGSLDTLALTADFGVKDARLDGVLVRRASGHAALERLPRYPTGTLTVTADSASYGGYTANRLQVRADVRDGRSGRVVADVTSGDSLSARGVADVERGSDTTRVALDSLRVTLGDGTWRLQRPTHIVRSNGRLIVDSTTLVSSRGALLSVVATLPDAGAAEGSLRLEGFGPAELGFIGLFPPDVEGRLRANVRLTGTRDSPQLAFDAALDSVKVKAREAPSLAVTGTYANRRMHVDARGSTARREMLNVVGDLPMDLSLRSVPKRLLDDSLTVKIRADSATLTGLEAVIPNVEGLRGSLSANLDVRGGWKQVSGSGTVSIRDGAAEFPKYGTVLKALSMDDTLSRDSLRIHLRTSDGDDARNVATVDGALWLEKQRWQSNLNSVGRTFRVLDDPRLATAVANWVVHFTGPLAAPVLEGDLALLNATFVIGGQRNVRVLRSDTANAEAQQAVRRARISSLRVFLGNDVRLKSRDANVKLSGEVEMTGALLNPFVDGEIYADRGTYRVDLGVLKRTFRVDSGTVRVSGRRDTPAALNIWTSYVVRRIEAEDVTINARLVGTTDAPRLTLGSSDLGSAVAQSEIISYLIFGSPSFALEGTGSSTVRSATAALVPSLGGVLENALGALFPFFSSLQVTAIAGSGPRNLNPLEGLLNSFALTAGRQIGAESFLNLSGGVCRGSQLASTQSPAGWYAISVEYRPKNQLGAVVSVEPGASPCSGLSRYQFGLDLFKDWKF